MKKSAGLLMFRLTPLGPLVLLAHPGGPYWTRKDHGAWTIPKGEYEEPEEALAAAQREFREETGFEPAPPYLALGDVRLKSGKRIAAWAFEGDCDPQGLCSNTFEMEWPPRSGRRQSYAEIDRIAWFTLDEGRVKLNEAQAALLPRLAAVLSERATGRA